VTRSIGAVGTSADNAACESFHASLKRETLQGARDYGDADTCRRTVFAWLTRYNTRRRRSANGDGRGVRRVKGRQRGVRTQRWLERNLLDMGLVILIDASIVVWSNSLGGESI